MRTACRSASAYVRIRRARIAVRRRPRQSVAVLHSLRAALQWLPAAAVAQQLPVRATASSIASARSTAGMRTQLYVAMAVIFGLGECGLGYVLWRLYLKQQIKPVMLLLTAALTWTTGAAGCIAHSATAL